MSICRTILGLSFSVVAGEAVIYPSVECLWKHVQKGRERIDESSPSKKHSLNWLVGSLERLLYAASLSIGAWQWVGIWLVMKAAARWRASATRIQPPQEDNIWLIGNALSVSFGFIGAWIVLGKLPSR